jgi:hypothetical protein
MNNNYIINDDKDCFYFLAFQLIFTQPLRIMHNRVYEVQGESTRPSPLHTQIFFLHIEGK